MRRRSVIATAAAASLLLAACGSSSSTASPKSTTATAPPTSYPHSHTLTLSFLQDPGQPPDPDVYYAGEGLLLTRNLYQGLVSYQPGTATRKIIPQLATSWSISKNGLDYTFHLRHGVTFHDGTPFTSAAIGASFARRLAVNGGPAYQVAGVARVVTHGPYAATIVLKQRNSAFMDYLAAPYGPVMESPTALKAHAGSNHDQTYLQTHDIGTGPYTLTKAKVGVDYQMVAYPKYWGKKPYYTTINMPVIDSLTTEEEEFNTGAIAGILHDLTPSAIKQYAGESGVREYTLPTTESDTLYVNENKGLFTSLAARQALLKAVDIPAIVAGVFPNHAATVPTQTGPDNLIAKQYAQQKITYDPSPLTSIVRKAPAAERSIVIGYDTGSPDDQLIAEQIGAELQAVGLSAKVVGYQTSEIYGWVGSVKANKGPATPNMLVDYFWPDADNPYTWTHIAFDPTGGLQYMACNVPGIAKVDTQAATTGSDALYNQVSNMALASGCWLNIADRLDVMVFKPWMQGVAAAHVVAAPETLRLNYLYPA